MPLPLQMPDTDFSSAKNFRLVFLLMSFTIDSVFFFVILSDLNG